MQFSEEIIKIFDYIGEKFGIAIDWSNANVVPYIQELCGRYINWEIATSVVWMLIGFVILMFLIPVRKRYKEHKKDYKDGKIGYCDYSDYTFTANLISIGLAILGLSFVLTQIFDIIRCICIPELQIYEYITTLMQNQ